VTLWVSHFATRQWPKSDKHFLSEARVLDKTVSSIEKHKGPWSLEASKTIINDVSEELQIKGAKLITPLRWALTGSKV
jgi:hypothetical protein